MYIKTLTVSALNNYMKKITDNDIILNNVLLKGEISNFKLHSSGHMYFTLKDDFSKINCLMFRNQAGEVNFKLKDGLKIIAKGRVSVYEKEGTYQFYCSEMKQDGIGELYIAFQELKEKLEKRGLFSSEHKKPIPRYAKKIGVITSPTGAAIRDIINVSKRRNSGIEIVIYPSLVQGESASSELIKGIEYFNKKSDVDTIILARGGGSIEELWAFNDEKLAYSVYESKKPIVTGVGHETDFTIVDYVSDRRAPTPSAAAEIAVPSLSELNEKILSQRYMLERILRESISRRLTKLNIYRKTLELHNPLNIITNQYVKIDSHKNNLYYKTMQRIAHRKEKLGRMYEVFRALNPLNILDKGYAVIEDCNKNIISTVEQLKSSEEVVVTLKDGSIKTNIKPID